MVRTRDKLSILCTDDVGRTRDKLSILFTDDVAGAQNEREQLLALNQVLARQVMERSRLVAGNGMRKQTYIRKMSANCNPLILVKQDTHVFFYCLRIKVRRLPSPLPQATFFKFSFNTWKWIENK